MEKTDQILLPARRANDMNVWKAVKKIIPYILLAILVLFFLFPIYIMVIKSLMPSSQVARPDAGLWPEEFVWENYVRLFVEKNYFAAGLHTLEIILFNILAIPFSASLVAYSFAKLEWRGKNIVFAVMMATIMLPGVVTQIPLYVMYVNMHWIDTIFPLTIPNIFGGGAMNIFLIRQFMKGIPREIDNAAKIDGAGPFKRYFYITLPNCKAILIYIMVNVFISNWGDFYGPLVYMVSSNAPRTLAYVIFLDSMQADSAPANANMRMAAGVIMTVIPTILFFFFQKQLIEGVATVGLKG